jgi:hypothetical protein
MTTTLIVHDRIASYTDLVSPDTFRYSPERRWRWLQKVCFWILWKLDCRAVDKHVTYTTIEIDQSKIPQTALAQISRIKRHGGEPDFILIGAEGFLEYQSSGYALQYEARYCEERDKKHQWYGVDVRVVPDFKGCVVVPRV